MKYEQSRWQSIIYRLYSLGINLILPTLVFVLGTYLGYISNTDFFEVYIFLFVLLLILRTLWLIVFNSGRHKVDEYAIEFDDKGIHYFTMAEKTSIPWDAYKGFEVKRFLSVLPCKILIYGKENKNIIIERYVFNKLQCNAICTQLKNCVNQE